MIPIVRFVNTRTTNMTIYTEENFDSCICQIYVFMYIMLTSHLTAKIRYFLTGIPQQCYCYNRTYLYETDE